MPQEYHGSIQKRVLEKDLDIALISIVDMWLIRSQILIKVTLGFMLPAKQSQYG